MAKRSRRVIAAGGLALCAMVAAFFVLAELRPAVALEPREETGFGSNPGNLRMFSAVPADLKAPAALVVVLHGCKQQAATFARDAGWLDLADSAKVALLLPEQKGLNPYWYDSPWAAPWVSWLGANNQNACFNWFEPGDTARDRGEAQSIAQMIDAMVARYPIDRARIYIAGLSAGGAMTAVMLAVYPERFAGGAIVAGVPFGCADTVLQALRCMSPGIDRTPEQWRAPLASSSPAAKRYPPVSIWHGDADDRVDVRNRAELVEQWTAAHGIAASAPQKPDNNNEAVTREIYVDADGTPKVESVLVKGLAHAFPIRAGGKPPCGQAGDFVVDAEVCAARDIARFWGLFGGM